MCYGAAMYSDGRLAEAKITPHTDSLQGRMPSAGFIITLLAVVFPNGSLSTRLEEWTEEQRLEAETCDMPILRFKSKNAEDEKETFEIAPRHEEAYLKCPAD